MWSFNLFKKEQDIMSALDDLTAQVAANNNVIQSAVTLLTGLKASLDAAIASAKQMGDTSPIEALSASLGTSDAALAAAITANTPAAAPAPAAVSVAAPAPAAVSVAAPAQSATDI
jgi:nucleoid-associated protein YgaU